MHVDLIKLLGSFLGFIISWKLIFLIFSPSELSAVLMVTILLFAAYGIQLTQWPEESSFSILGLSIYQSITIKQQYRIFGVIPLHHAVTIQTHSSILSDMDPYVALPATKLLISSLPFGGLFGRP